MSFSTILASHIVAVDDVETGMDNPFAWNLVKIEKHDYSGEWQRKVLGPYALALIYPYRFRFIQDLKSYSFLDVAYINGNHPCIKSKNRSVQHEPIIT
jgi:hypothetical protein